MDNANRKLHPAYFETLFEGPDLSEPWPASFAIITAYARTGTQKSLPANLAADTHLALELRRRGCWFRRLVGFSPDGQHAEPGWVVDLSFNDACDLGKVFDQDAIYFVNGDELYVSHCDQGRTLTRVGSFRERLR